jgi:hypothetical protein
MSFRTIVLALAAVAGTAVAQQPAAPVLHAIDNLKLREDGPLLRQRVQTGEPFTVAGPQGVVVGEQQGVFEAWVLPVKLLSHMAIEANVEGYDVPIDLNSMAREIEVRPDRTTITYTHIALTVRQTMFAPDEAAEGTGVVVLFQVDALHPVDLTFRFTAEMRQMWPELRRDRAGCICCTQISLSLLEPWRCRERRMASWRLTRSGPQCIRWSFICMLIRRRIGIVCIRC